MVLLSKSAKLYQERRIPDDRLTRRRPAPRASIAQNKVHQIPLKPPSPLPSVLHIEQVSDPDATLTQPWPHGEEELS